MEERLGKLVVLERLAEKEIPTSPLAVALTLVNCGAGGAATITMVQTTVVLPAELVAVT